MKELSRRSFIQSGLALGAAGSAAAADSKRDRPRGVDPGSHTSIGKTHLFYDHFWCTISFIHDLTTDATNYYRDEMSLEERVRYARHVPEYAAMGFQDKFEEVLSGPEFQPTRIDGQSTAIGDPVIPCLDDPHGLGLSSIGKSIERATTAFDRALFGTSPAENMSDSPTPDDGTLTRTLTCKQRIWNPNTKLWEWEFNYTLSVAGATEYSSADILARFESNGGKRHPRLDSNFRFIAKLWT